MKNMIQTYQGYFQEDGRFIPDNLSIPLPTRQRAIVNILDDEVAPKPIVSREVVLKQLFIKAEKAEGSLTDDEWMEFEKLR